MDNVKTGNFIKQLRKEKGLTQKDIAEQLHITDRAVSKWERGLCAPDIALLEPLSKLLGVSVIDLIEGSRRIPNTHTEDFTDSIIAYSTREIHVNETKNRRTVHICVGAMTLILCFVIASALMARFHDRKRDEALCMNHIYSKFNEIIWITDDILRDDLPNNERATLFLQLHYSLRSTAEELEDGYHYVSECIPSAASWWFLERASVISNNQDIFLEEQGSLSVEGELFLTQLHSDMRELIEPLTGADQMNLNTELSIEAFASVILDFYHTH